MSHINTSLGAAILLHAHNVATVSRTEISGVTATCSVLLQGRRLTYQLLRRSRDMDVGVTHLKNPHDTYIALCEQGFAMLRLALCEQGFAMLRLDDSIKHDAVPTCVFCVVGKASGLRYWKLYGGDNVYRTTVEEGLAAPDKINLATDVMG